MKLVIGSDHGGFQLKEELKKFLQAQGHSVTDFGCYSEESVDYPDIACLVGEAVARHEFDRGLLLDGTGAGVCLTANKIPGIRAVLAYNEITGRFASEHDDANILCLGGKMIGSLLAQEIVLAWLSSSMKEERHKRRLGKVLVIEQKYLKSL